MILENHPLKASLDSIFNALSFSVLNIPSHFYDLILACSYSASLIKV